MRPTDEGDLQRIKKTHGSGNPARNLGREYVKVPKNLTLVPLQQPLDLDQPCISSHEAHIKRAEFGSRLKINDRIV